MIKNMLNLSVVLCLFVNIKSFAYSIVQDANQRFEQFVDYRFDNWRKEDGLPQLTVNDITEDQLGFIWLATAGGVGKFDGNNFKSFSSDNGQLLNNNTLSLVADHQGWIWVGTNSGLTRIHHLTYESQHFLADETKPDSLVGNDISALHVDKKGDVWVGTSKGLSQFIAETQSFQTYDVFIGSQKDVTSGYISIGSDSQNRLFVLSSKGQLFLFDQQQQHFSLYKEVPGASTLLIDNNDHLWIAGITPTITIYDLQSNHKQSATLLGKGHVRAIAIDSKGYVWLATLYDGVQIVSPQLKVQRVSENITEHNKSLFTEIYRTIYIDKSDRAWLGGHQFGLFRQNKVAETISQFINPQQQGRYAFATTEMLDGDIWLGFNNRIDIVDSNHFGRLKHSIEMKGFTYDIKQLDGNTWLASTISGLFKIERQNNQYTKKAIYQSDNIAGFRMVLHGQSLYVGGHDGIYYIDDMTQWDQPLTKLQAKLSQDLPFRLDVYYYGGILDDQGRIWFIGQKGGIVYVDPKYNLVEPQTLITDEQGIAISPTSIRQFNQDTLLLSSLSGLYQYDINTKKPTPIDLFHEQTPVCELIIKDNDIWLNAKVGVIQLEKSDFKIKRILTEKHGMFESCLIVSGTKTKDGCFVFGRINGVNHFCPDELPNTNMNKINPPLFTDLNINYKEHLSFDQYQQYTKKPIFTSNSLMFDYHVNQFGLDFTTIDFSGRQLSYAYKLDGLMDEWIYSDTKKWLLRHYLAVNIHYKFKSMTNCGHRMLPLGNLRL